MRFYKIISRIKFWKKACPHFLLFLLRIGTLYAVYPLCSTTVNVPSVHFELLNNNWAFEATVDQRSEAEGAFFNTVWLPVGAERTEIKIFCLRLPMQKQTEVWPCSVWSVAAASHATRVVVLCHASWDFIADHLAFLLAVFCCCFFMSLVLNLLHQLI